MNNNTPWQPIETAPTNERILLAYQNPVFTGVKVITGAYEKDTYSNKPKPYWKHDLYRLSGVSATRSNQPTHWMPIPLFE